MKKRTQSRKQRPKASRRPKQAQLKRRLRQMDLKLDHLIRRLPKWNGNHLHYSHSEKDFVDRP
jgi:hypothetical protein